MCKRNKMLKWYKVCDKFHLPSWFQVFERWVMKLQFSGHIVGFLWSLELEQKIFFNVWEALFSKPNIYILALKWPEELFTQQHLYFCNNLNGFYRKKIFLYPCPFIYTEEFFQCQFLRNWFRLFGVWARRLKRFLGEKTVLRKQIGRN